MINKTVTVTLALLLVVYLAALGWTGYRFFVASYSGNALSVEPLEMISVPLQESASVDLPGQGFSNDTRVFMHMDVNNQDAIVGVVPLLSIAHDLELIGDTLLVASNGNGVRRIDVSNPLKPKMSSVPWMNNVAVLDINRHGDTLYFSCGKHGVLISKIIDNNKFYNVLRLNTWSMAVASKVVGHYLYVAANNDGLLVYDLNELQRKKPIAIVDPGGPVRGLAAYGNYLYVVAGKLGTLIYELDENGMPLPVGRLGTEQSVKAVKVVGDSLNLFINGAIRQYSLTEPDSPQLLAEHLGLDSPSDFQRIGDEIYILDKSHGLGRVASVSGMLGEGAGFVNIGAKPMALANVGSYLYVANSRKEISIIDPKMILPRQTITRIPTPFRVNDFLVVEDYLYLVCRGGLFSYNLSSPASKLQQVSSGFFTGIMRESDHLYVLGNQNGVDLFDISQAASPRKIAAWTELRARELDVDGELLYLAHQDDGLSLYRKGKFEALKKHDQVDDIEARSVVGGGGMAAVAVAEQGIKFYRIDDDRLVFISELKLPFPLANFSEVSEFHRVGDIIYVANGEAGLMIIDIANPAKPQLVSSLKLPGLASGLLVDGKRIYVAGRSSGLHTVDVSRLDRPKLVDTVVMPAMSNRVQSYDGKLYVNNGPLGIEAIPKPVELKTRLVAEGRLVIEIPAISIPGRYSLYVSDKNNAATLSSVLTVVQ